MRSIDEIYRELPDGELPAGLATQDLRLGVPLAILLAMLVLGFWTVLVPFCSGISR